MLQQAKEIAETDVMEKLSRFAYINKQDRLVICGRPSINWDAHYLAAIRILRKCVSKKITYDIVVQLRCWLRENAEHGLGVDFGGCRNLDDVRRKIDEAIRIEHLYCKDKSEMHRALKYNDEVFARADKKVKQSKTTNNGHIKID